MNSILNKNYGYNLHVIKTDKFKTNSITVKFAAELKAENVTTRALIPGILFAGTKKYPSKRLLIKKLEELYDASMSLRSIKVGSLNVIEVRMTFLNDLYLDETILEEIIDILKEVLYNPFLIDGNFDEVKIKEEKRIFNEFYDSLKDDKTGYALTKLSDYMFKDSKFGIRIAGYKKDLEKITKEVLYSEYQNMINNDCTDVIIVGDFEDLTPFKKLKFKSYDEIPNIYYDKFIDSNQVDEYVEYDQLNQSKLNIGFQTGITVKNELYVALILGNSIYGGGSFNTMLFDTLREKNSLCYYVKTHYSAYSGTIHLYCGISKNNYQKSLDLIKDELKKLKNGEFTDEKLEIAKKGLINSYLESLDGQANLGYKAYTDYLKEESRDYKYIIDKVNQCSKEEILEAVKNIEIDTIFLLTTEDK